MPKEPQQDVIKSNAIAIATQIIDTAPSEHMLIHMMEQLILFGETITAKLESTEPDARIACSRGCSYCCHMQVKVTPPEMFLILAHLTAEFNPAQMDILTEKIANNRRLTEGKDLEERVDMRHHTPCIFLHNHRCTIYPARPLICRAWHSLDNSACESAYLLEDANAEIDTLPYRNYVYSMIREAVEAVCAEHEWHYGVFELPLAMSLCLNRPLAMAHWLKSEPLIDIT